LLTGIHILVVEDNILNQKIVNFILKKEGAEIVSAMNGNEAIEQLRVRDFDVVLMDLQMPGLDGFGASRYIRKELRSDVPIIALTADVFVSETSNCLDAGMNACISKPFETNELSALVLRLIEERKINSVKQSV
jgi:two-component system, sensor histidine kinase